MQINNNAEKPQGGNQAKVSQPKTGKVGRVITGDMRSFKEKYLVNSWDFVPHEGVMVARDLFFLSWFKRHYQRDFRK